MCKYPWLKDGWWSEESWPGPLSWTWSAQRRSHHWWTMRQIGQCSLKLFILRLTIERKPEKQLGVWNVQLPSMTQMKAVGMQPATRRDVHTDSSVCKNSSYFPRLFFQSSLSHLGLFFWHPPAAIWNHRATSLIDSSLRAIEAPQKQKKRSKLPSRQRLNLWPPIEMSLYETSGHMFDSTRFKIDQTSRFDEAAVTNKASKGLIANMKLSTFNSPVENPSWREVLFSALWCCLCFSSSQVSGDHTSPHLPGPAERSADGEDDPGRVAGVSVHHPATLLRLGQKCPHSRCVPH